MAPHGMALVVAQAAVGVRLPRIGTNGDAQQLDGGNHQAE